MIIKKVKGDIMELYIICNNLVENNLSYDNRHDIETKKMTRPLSIEGENLAKNISLLEDLNNIDNIYSSMFASSMASAKYLAKRYDKKIIVSEKYNDCKVGSLGNKSLKMVRFMQNHDFNIKLNEGESLNEVGERMESAISMLLHENEGKVALFTHKRAMLGYLINHCDTGYNLDDDLIVTFNDEVVYNEADKEVDMIKIVYSKSGNILDVKIIDL